MEIIKKKCKLCPLVIEGTSESQVDYNMNTHVTTQHKKVKKNGAIIEK